MLSNHIKKGLWLWIAACVVLWVGCRQPQFQQFAESMARLAMFGLLGGTALLAIALGIVSYKERSRAAQRLTELHRRVQSGETVEIRGGSGLPRLIVVSAFTWIFVYALHGGGAPGAWIVQACVGIVVAALTFYELLTVVPLLRQPILHISRESLESPIFGKLSWQDIQRFDLSDTEARGASLHHRLDLEIQSLPRLSAQLHPATRLKQRIHSFFRPSTRLRVRLLRASEMPKVILTLCQRTSSAYMMESQRERAMEEMKASLRSEVTPSSRAPTQAEATFKAKLDAQIDAVGFEEAMRLQREEARKEMDEMWEWRITPPPDLMRTHWTTWVATAIAAVVMAAFIYLLFSAPV